MQEKRWEKVMPFQSEKQRRYLWANEPEIAKRWTKKYGSKVRKKKKKKPMDYFKKR